MGFILGGLDTENYDRTYSDRELIRRIIGYFEREWKRMLLVAAMILLNSGFNTARPLLITRGIDMLAANPTPERVVLLSVVILVLGATAWTFNFWRTRASVRAVGNVVLRLRSDAFKTVTEHDLSFYDENASGKIVSRVTSDTQDFSQVVTLVMDLLSQIVLVVILLVILFFIHWQLTLVVISTGPFMILLSLGLRKIARRVTLRAKQARATVNANVQESVSGIAVAKGFRQEHALYDAFEEINQKTYRIGEQVRIHLRATEDCYVTLIDLQTDGTMYVLFPNGFKRDNFCRAGRRYSVPGPSAPYVIDVGGPTGVEGIRAVATRSPIGAGAPPTTGIRSLKLRERKTFLSDVEAELKRLSPADRAVAKWTFRITR